MTTATKYKTYPKYKPSGIDWLGDIPDGWEVKRLKHAVKELVGGGTPDTGNDQNWTDDENGTPWVNIADMTNAFYIQETEKRVTALGLEEKNLRVLPKNTLLYSMYASLGKVALLDIEAVTNQAILGVVEDKHKASSDFIKWWLISIENHLALFSTSSTQNNLNEFKVKNMPLFLPVLPQQKSIADFLDRETAKIDEMVAKKQKMMELLKEKRQALITHAVTKGLDPKVKMKPSGIDWLGDIPDGWEVKRLKYVSNSRVSNVDKKNEDEIVVRLCNYMDVYKNEFINEDIKFMVATATSDQISNFQLKQEDVIITKDSETPDDIGVPAFVKLENTENIVCGYHLAISTPNKKVLIGEYLFRLFQSKFFRSYFEVNCNGVTRFGLDTYSVFNANILLPSLSEQRTIIDFLNRKTEKIDEMMKKAETQIEKLKEYRQALITSAVTGKIMVS